MTLLRNSLTSVWLLLVGITLLSWWLGVGQSGAINQDPALQFNFALTAGIVLIAVVKTRLVIWHFMEVKHGPVWLRWVCDSWLAVLIITVVALYRYNL